MATQFEVELDNVPGTLAHLGEVLGESQINIEAVQGYPCGDTVMVNFIVDKVDDTRRALEEAGIAYSNQKVLVVTVLDEPGMMGDVARVMAHAGINIESIYVTLGGNLVLVVDDMDGAIQVAKGMAVQHV